MDMPQDQYETDEQINEEPTEDLEGEFVEEYNEEEAVEADEYGEESGDSSVVDAPDDFQLQIPVRRLDGTVEEITLDQDDLADVVSKGKHFDVLLQEAQRLEQQAHQSKALVNFVAADPLLSRMTYMRANGYSETEILNDLQQIVSTMSQNQNTDPMFDEMDDHQKQIYLKVKEEESRRMQLEQQVAAMQNERTLQTVATHNSQVFDGALTELGLNYSGEADIPKIQKAIMDLYPNVDPRSFKFNKQQAQAILRYAGLGKRGSQTQTKIQQVNKAKSAPRVVGGSKSSGTNKRDIGQKLGFTPEDRRKALLGLGL